MWPRLVDTLVGLWLMAAPAVLGYAGAARANDRIVGPLVASIAVIAIWEVTRPLRWTNVALGAWLLAAPWLFGAGPAPLLNDMTAGLLLIAMALKRGPSRTRVGGGWSAVLPGRSQTQRR